MLTSYMYIYVRKYLSQAEEYKIEYTLRKKIVLVLQPKRKSIYNQENHN